MEAKRKEIKVEERNIILKLQRDGLNYRQIGRTLGRAWTSVRTVIQNFQKTGIITSKPGSGRPRLLTDRESRSVLSIIKKNPQTTALQVTADVKEKFKKQISQSTARRILRRAGFHGRVARKKPFISLVNRKKRIEFANKYVNMGPDFWKRVIFSDENKFCIFGIKGRKIVWRQTGTALDRQNLLPTVKHGGGGVMIWGYMAAGGVGNMEFIDSKMDRFVYLDILKRNLKQSAEKLGLANDFYFQQDNDPKHTAEIVKLCLLYNVPKMLSTPPQFPDINPIEHLWALLERKIRQRAITSKTMLKDVMKEEWENITSEETTHLVNSMQNRLREVLNRRGYPTRY